MTTSPRLNRSTQASSNPKADAAGAISLLGRDDLLQQLAGCWETARRGRPLVVRLIGDPGIGKSSLVKAFISGLHSDARLVFVEAKSDLQHASYRFLEALVSAWGANDEDFGQDASAVRHLLGREAVVTPPTSSKVTWFIAFRALSRWMTQQVEANATLVVIEDLHWVDQGSLHFLDYWLNEIGNAANRPFMLLLTERSGGGYHLRANGLGNITLPVLPLDDTHAMRLALQHLGVGDGALPDELHAEVAEVLNRAKGNPFLLTELLRHRAAGGEIPDSVRDSVMARFQELNPAAQSLLGMLAVVGFHLDPMLLNVLSAGNTRTILELVNAGFLILDGTAYRWSHALLQQAVYEAMDPELRRRRHAKIAAHMQERSKNYPAYTAPEAARHLLGAGQILEARALLLEAANYALLRYDLKEGRDLLARAIELFEPADPDYAMYAVRLAEVELARAQGAEACRLLKSLDGASAPGWTLAMVRVHERLGDYEAAEVLLREALAAIPSPPERPALELALAQLELRQGHYAACEQRAASALRLNLSRQELGLAYSLMGVSCYRLGRYEEALRHHQRALAEREACQDLAGVASSYNNLGSLFYEQGNWKEAAQAYHRGKLLAERIGEAWLASAFDNNLGNLALNQGDWEDAERYYRAALATKEKLGERAGIAISLCNLGNVLRRMRRFDEARAHLEQAIALMEAIGDREVMSDLFYHLGMIEVDAEQDARAWDLLQRAIDLGTELKRTVPVGVAYRGQSVLLMRRGEAAQAFDRIQASLNLLEGAFASLEHARSLEQAAVVAEALGHPARARAYRLCARDAFEKLGAKDDLARLAEVA